MSEEASLKDLVDRLPDDPLSEAVKAKVAGLNSQMQRLVSEHRKMKEENRQYKETNKKLHGEKETARKKLEEQLASIKANVDAMEQSKREQDGYTILWTYGDDLMARVFRERQKALDFYSAIGGVSKVMCESEIKNMHQVELNVEQFLVEQFLRMQHEKLESRMAALGFENEVGIPEQVEDTLRLARDFIYAVEDEPGDTPHHVLARELKERLNEMLIDDDDVEPPDWRHPDWRHPDDVEDEVEDMVSEAEGE